MNPTDLDDKLKRIEHQDDKLKHVGQDAGIKCFRKTGIIIGRLSSTKLVKTNSSDRIYIINKILKTGGEGALSVVHSGVIL